MQVDPFHAISVARLAYRLQSEGRSVIHLEFGQPSTGAPADALKVAHRILDSEPMGYWESVPLRERIARHYAERYGVTVKPERIVLTCGASPALIVALMSAFSPGASVALARPGYVAYRNTLKSLHMKPVEIACGPDVRYQLSREALETLQTMPDGVIIASPANPTGSVIPPAQLSALVGFCRTREIRIVSDEIYHGISYGEPTQTLLQHDPNALIINSFSKYLCMAGWRLGWVVAPDDLAEALRARAGFLYLTPSSLSQHAALVAFDCTAELDGYIETYRRNRSLLLDALPSIGFGPIAPPDGAFYLYVSIAHLSGNSLEFCERLLLDTGVAIAPGVDFDPVLGHRFVRFSFAASTPQVVEAIERLRQWLPTQRSSTP